MFQGPRRYFLQARSGKQDIWSYGLSRRILVENEFKPLYFFSEQTLEGSARLWFGKPEGYVLISVASFLDASRLHRPMPLILRTYMEATI